MPALVIIVERIPSSKHGTLRRVASRGTFRTRPRQTWMVMSSLNFQPNAKPGNNPTAKVGEMQVICAQCLQSVDCAVTHSNGITAVCSSPLSTRSA